jgi:hypothetical protein
MLDRFYRRPKVLQRLRSGPLGPHLDSVAAQLLEMGFTSENSGEHQCICSTSSTSGFRRGASG